MLHYTCIIRLSSIDFLCNCTYEYTSLSSDHYEHRLLNPDIFFRSNTANLLRYPALNRFLSANEKKKKQFEGYLLFGHSSFYSFRFISSSEDTEIFFGMSPNFEKVLPIFAILPRKERSEDAALRKKRYTHNIGPSKAHRISDLSSFQQCA